MTTLLCFDQLFIFHCSTIFWLGTCLVDQLGEGADDTAVVQVELAADLGLDDGLAPGRLAHFAC